MQKPVWRVNFGHARYGLTGFRLQSTICFVIILSLGFLLRLSTIVWGVSSRCVEADQFWFEPYKSDRPLGGIFFLVLFLLLAWNASIYLNYVVRKKRGFFLPIVNFIAIFALLLISIPGYNESQISYDVRNDSYGQWLTSDHQRWPFFEDSCLLAADYLGKWEVIDQNLPPHGARFPGREIEFQQSLKFTARDSRWDEPVIGYWKPPSVDWRLSENTRGSGEIYWGRQIAIWDFRLEGNSLILTTPDWVDWYAYSSVTLRRVKDE